MYTTWKVDSATPMYWFIMAPYKVTFWELRHLLSLGCIPVAFAKLQACQKIDPESFRSSKFGLGLIVYNPHQA